MANFPKKQQDRAFDSAAVNHLGDLYKLHTILEIKLNVCDMQYFTMVLLTTKKDLNGEIAK